MNNLSHNLDCPLGVDSEPKRRMVLRESPWNWPKWHRLLAVGSA